MERSGNPRGRNLSGSRTHAGKYSAEGIGVEFYGIPEREEQSDDLRTIREPEIQVQGKRILVPRIIRRYSGKNKQKIAEYIKHQLDEDRLGDQMTMFGKDDDPFKGGK